jgi:hypothetical protein
MVLPMVLSLCLCDGPDEVSPFSSGSRRVASEESFEMLVVAGDVGGESCEEFQGSASPVRKFASFCQDNDGRVIKNDSVKSEG